MFGVTTCTLRPICLWKLPNWLKTIYVERKKIFVGMHRRNFAGALFSHPLFQWRHNCQENAQAKRFGLSCAHMYIHIYIYTHKNTQACTDRPIVYQFLHIVGIKWWHWYKCMSRLVMFRNFWGHPWLPWPRQVLPLLTKSLPPVPPPTRTWQGPRVLESASAHHLTRLDRAVDSVSWQI